MTSDRGALARLSIVVPIYNELEVVPQLVDRLTRALDGAGAGAWEAILVDDGSADRSFEALREAHGRDPRLKVVRLARNFGHQVAISAGLEYASGDAVMIMDGDLQDPPELVPEFVRLWRDGWDVVYAVRRTRQEAWIKRVAYQLFYRLLRMLARLDIPLDSGDFCLMDRCVVDVVVRMRERNRFVRGLRTWAGFRQTALPYDRDPRAGGAPKYTFRRLVHLALDGIVGFSYFPLRLGTLLGIGAAAVSFLGIVFVLYLRLFTDRSIPGFASTAIIILFLGGVQLFTLGLIGEYVGRIYDEVRRRPLFVVRERVGLPDASTTEAGWRR
ncbi:MAG TPA: glycosyltransferase family 2 protein [Vicinamibacterales bacterium]|jgi:dolichol-phosphate mannosyltransferase|nr:glycosyltransferase family 2 protein [Vicinamibacterales bacterium]